MFRKIKEKRGAAQDAGCSWKLGEPSSALAGARGGHARRFREHGAAARGPQDRNAASETPGLQMPTSSRGASRRPAL